MYVCMDVCLYGLHFCQAQLHILQLPVCLLTFQQKLTMFKIYKTKMFDLHHKNHFVEIYWEVYFQNGLAAGRTGAEYIQMLSVDDKSRKRFGNL